MEMKRDKYFSFKIFRVTKCDLIENLAFGTLTVEVLVVVLLRPELASVYQGIGGGEIGHGARV